MKAALSEIQEQTVSQTAELASFAARLRFEDLPADVIEKAKICFRDALACCLFGVTQPWTRMLIDQAIEETLRFESPIQAWFRRATEDVELSGVTVPKDEMVLVVLGDGEPYYEDRHRVSPW